ncbi:MAG: hypothetical protein O7G88_05210 [bacterium]|nr:hypothetical protein [bacterium]
MHSREGITMDDYPKLVFHGQIKEKKIKGCKWLFSPKDVIILTCIAFSISGLMGLGSIMVIDFIDSLMQMG